MSVRIHIRIMIVSVSIYIYTYTMCIGLFMLFTLQVVILDDQEETHHLRGSSAKNTQQKEFGICKQCFEILFVIFWELRKWLPFLSLSPEDRGHGYFDPHTFI